MRKLLFLTLFFIPFLLYSGGIFIPQPIDVKNEVENTQFSTITANNITTTAINVSTITFQDGTVLTSTATLGGGGGGEPTNWSLYPAVSNVNLSSFGIVNLSTITFIDGRQMNTIPLLVTKIVSASNTLEKFKFMADYVCSGNNDEIIISTAIKAVSDLGGGAVLLLNGTYWISNTILLENRSNVIIIGENKFQTIIKSNLMPNYYTMIGLLNNNTVAENIEIKNLTIVVPTNYLVSAIGTKHGGSNQNYKNLRISDVIIISGQKGVNFIASTNNENIIVENTDMKFLSGTGDAYNNIAGKNIVLKNLFFDLPSSFDGVLLLFDNTTDVVISNNIFDFTKVSSGTVRNYFCAIGFNSYCYNIIARDNFIKCNWNGGNTLSLVSLHYYIYNAKILNNTFEGISTTAIEFSPFYNSNLKENVIISGNTFINCNKAIGQRVSSPVNNLIIMNNQVKNVGIPLALIKSSLNNYMIYFNSWESDVVDFDRGIVANSVIYKTPYSVGIDTPTATRQMVVDNNYDVWISTGTNNAWDWKKVSP